jgi:hypothetical protein
MVLSDFVSIGFLLLALGRKGKVNFKSGGNSPSCLGSMISGHQIFPEIEILSAGPTIILLQGKWIVHACSRFEAFKEGNKSSPFPFQPPLSFYLFKVVTF